MRRVLFCTKRLSTGGVSSLLMRILPKLDKNCFDISLLVMERAPKLESLLPSHIKIVTPEPKYDFIRWFIYNDGKSCLAYSALSKLLCERYPSLRTKESKFYANKLWLYGFKKLKENYDVVIDFHGYDYALTPYIINSIKASKKFFWVHDSRVEGFQKNISYIKKFSTVVCVSDTTKANFLDSYPELKDKLTVIKNVVNSREISELSNAPLDPTLLRFIQRYKHRIITTARLENQKGLDISIKAAAYLKLMGINFIWFICGTGSQESKLLDLTAKLGLSENIVFLGYLENPFPLVRHSDVFVLTSRHEGFGLSIAETMSLGLPIIASDLDVFKELQQGYDNFVTVPLEPLKIAEALYHTLNKDKNIRTPLRFDDQIMIEQISNLLMDN